MAAQPVLWIEGESATESKVLKHPWYHGEVKKDELSGGDFLSHFEKEYPGTASYDLEIAESGDFELWVRANPVQAKLSYQLDAAASQAIDMEKRQSGNVNIASNDKPDLRFLAWAHAGTLKLTKGKHRLSFRFDSENSNHGSLDCFVLAPAASNFTPMGILKPAEIAAQKDNLAKANQGWVPWLPAKDRFEGALLNLRPLNEKFAGEKGGIGVKGPDFIYRGTGEKVRFWAVNGPPHELKGEDLAECARTLAKRGVNLVRLHGAVFDNKTGTLDPAKVAHIHEIVAAMKKEGIYSHLSVYFPLWLTPENGPGWREGYDGSKHPFALLYFEPEFQKLYRGWMEALLTKPGPDGKKLTDEPALMGVELINEDSFFFWTFDEKNIPAPQLQKLEKQFATWAARKHGSLEKARAVWKLDHSHDAKDRVGFRSLYQIFTDKTLRDQDTATFLMETQRGFYEDSTKWLRAQGFKGLVTASNWTTANNDILGPLEKYSYMPGDFIDRHGYFSCQHKGDAAEWSIRDGHTYRDRSALRFEPEEPGKPLDFSHPSADPMFNGKPSMISETTWNRPNRYRGEAPLFYAAYGALQGSDGIVHFALDSKDWSVKPGYFMQPWTLMSPTQMGQFPAAAAIFRLGLVREGDVLADIPLTLEDALALKGSPLAPGASLDELRKVDAPGAQVPKGEDGIDPLIHYAGRTSVRIGQAGPSKLADLSRLIDRDKKLVKSSNGDLQLDYGKGLLTLNAPAAQGAVGDLEAAGSLDLKDLSIRSSMELGQIVAVSLDGKPLASSTRILLQVMSEEKASNFTTEPAGGGRLKITAIGSDPWLVRKLAGEVSFKRTDAANLKVTALDPNGMPSRVVGNAAGITLREDNPYYLIGPTEE
ncbi:hypothetical protein OJ996_06285 [Luteolibacter sp. GHJ8]|uniref:Glycoside hydrolase family 42 N-terminal domain-containing protein n=1 Tax=Luteolibacter rhizosphaerae TaxID=2989719 RepID=A0ABT3G010_9BACT|nr:hypothetical protein [Luteolibacter rhizosphaerae]MCW1913170.1 hypothetical protein [Luteolibacter rhizosphaerae]